ncbi:Pre-mRNA-splicing factor slt11 [Blastocladiella emersonii ATCC 22665]|nr:Pre-mRNA-splicing factor slt11 [Blastocladiella emersonii ATCC 22665]
MDDATKDPEFPIVCEPCLGDNPYMRMTTQQQGAECKECHRPYTTYRWVPGAGQRYRRTEICTVCAKLKNVCQSCILDLEYGMTTQVRDAVLGAEAAAGNVSSDANRRWLLRTAEANMAKTGKSLVDYGRIDSIAKDALRKMARAGSEPYAGGSSDKSAAHRKHIPGICGMWLKGKCTRGEHCQYRHELPKDKAKLADFIAKNGGTLPAHLQEHLHQHSSSQLASHLTHRSVQPPGARIADRHLREAEQAHAKSTTLLVTQLPESAANEPALRAHFEPFGEIKSVVVAAAKRCAFVNFTARDAAERAFETEAVIEGEPYKVAWGKARPVGPQAPTAAATAAASPTPGKGKQGGGNKYEYAAMNPSLIN